MTEEKLSTENSNMRLSPQSIEAEQALLGAILTNNRAMEKVVEFLKPEHFASAAHGKIYKACQTLSERGRLADPITLKDFFAREGSLEEVGGADYLFQLAASSTTTINAGDYGTQIFDRYIRRQLISFGTDVVNDAFEISLDNPAVHQIESAEKMLYDLADEGELEGGPKQLSFGANQLLQVTQEAMANPNGVGGVPTGLVDLDSLLGGLHNSNLIIIAGRPGMGKTALATCIATNVAEHFKEQNKKNAEKKSVAFFSLEMSSAELAGRILSNYTQIEGNRISSGKVSPSEFDKLAEAIKTLDELPLMVDETSAITVTAIKNRARRMKRDKSHGLGLIVIDYLQLIQESGRAENRVQALSEMTRSLKVMAKELGVPVIVLSQLSRLVESRDNKRPQLSDLRESGSIEQDADLVMFVFRESYYLENDKPVQREKESGESFQKRCQEWEQKKIDLAKRAEVNVAKNRHGDTRTINLYFDGKYTFFGNLAKESS
ncbi:MAG: replicative DNA helicase [Alphaproteobacteria bacterium]|nr:replicative DNA helicase [Alphaproteobacteria bacterium]